MNQADLNALMHAVLDNEATLGEARELDRVLAADPAARARFDDLKRLFDGLSGVPKAFPPEGLVASVIARLPPASARRDGSHQPFSQSGVIRQTSTEVEIPGRIPGDSEQVHRLSQPGPSFRGDNMSEQKIGSKRKVWIGVSIAVAAVVVASQYVDFPPSGKDVSGTIVPAVRYQAAQPTAADVKVGDTTAGSGSAGSPAAAGNAADAARGDASRGDAARGDAARGDAARGDAARGDAARGDAARGDAARGDASRGDAAKKGN